MKSALRKLTSVAVAVLMAALLVPAAAFAAGETGSITIENPVKDTTYTAYKIFDVAYNAGKTGASYSISESNEWFSVVANKDTDGTVKSNITGLKLTKTGDGVYEVTRDNTFSAADFAKTLKSNVTGKTGKASTLSGEKASISDLELGYYFVDNSTGALCNLTSTDPNASIHDKNDIPFDKVDDKDSVEVGEVVNYIITGKVPETAGFETYKYQITDKMSAGLTFNEDVAVFVDGTKIESNFTLKTGTDAGDKDFILDIDVMKLTVGSKIEVKYSATVNENAVTKIDKNHATLEYSTDPNDDTRTNTRQDEETVYSAKIVIDKFAADPENQNSTTGDRLQGAKFILYKEVTPEGASAPSKLYYKYTAATETESAKVEWVDNQNSATEVTTDNNGAAHFDGLKSGTYYLLETDAPAGYNLSTEPVMVTIDPTKDEQGNTIEVIEANLTHTEGIANNTGSTLPDTGGIGTTFFYVGGGLLIVGALAALIIKRRSAKHSA